MITRKEWSEFRDTGFVLFVNQMLQIFGWSIVFEMDGDEIKSVYPARVKFRGFSNDYISESYQKVREYMKNNASDLLDESQQP